MGRTVIVFILLFAAYCHAACSDSAECINTVKEPTTILPKQGYTKQPDVRGTLKILWTCAFTLFLCSWSTLCLALPGPDDHWWTTFFRRLLLTGLALLAPELVFAGALDQLMSARRSVKAFHKSDYNDWTLTHAFFADAGGFVLHTSDFVPFPLNAQQLHYLVTRGYLKMPSTSKKDIADKNKVDTILRLITLWQILWFSLNMLLRAIEGLHITTLELTTLAFILCSFGSFLCWLDKPADVTLPTVLSTDMTLRQILQDADVTLSAHSYRFTPLDFISRKEWHWSRSWAHWINIARRLRLDFNPQRKPVDRIQNTMTVPVTGSWYALILLMSYAYAAVFLVAWDHEFPTITERWLWRFASVSVLVTLLLYDLVEKWGFRWWPRIRERLLGDQRYRRWRRRLEWYPRRPVEKKVRGAVHFVAKRVRNNTVSQDPELGIPLKVQLPLYVLCFFYMLGRAIISFLDIIELRLLPVDAYKEAELTNLFPHL